MKKILLATAAVVSLSTTAHAESLPSEMMGMWCSDSGGCGCLNRISASISGASAGVRPPRGKAAS